VGFTLIDTGMGDDSVVIGNFSEKGDVVFLGAVSILTGEGMDFVELGNSFDSSDRVQFAAPVVILTGAQADRVRFRKSQFKSLLTVEVGSNDSTTAKDEISLGDVKVEGLSFFRSAGLASINIETEVVSTSTTRFGKAAFFAMASGNVVVGNGRQTTPVVIFDAAQTYIGTRSRISVKYVGNVQANLAQRRLFRAVLE
jgi:hypothetical protein